MQLARFDDLLEDINGLKNQAQNDFKIKIINKKLFKINSKNHTNVLKSRFKIIRFEIIPNTDTINTQV